MREKCLTMGEIRTELLLRNEIRRLIWEGEVRASIQLDRPMINLDVGRGAPSRRVNIVGIRIGDVRRHDEQDRQQR